MPKIDLLPCPFCGRIPKRRELNILLYVIGCSFSKCHERPWVIKETPEEAAEAWNTRASGWIPCSERMPETTEKGLGVLYSDCLLVVSSKTGWTAMAYFLTDGEKSWWEFADAQNKIKIDWDEVTHWMPLPELPKGES